MKALVLVLCLTLTACSTSPWMLLKPRPKGVEIETEINTGQMDRSIQVGSEQRNMQQARQIQNLYQALEWWQWLIIMLMAGWAIPTPFQTWRGIINAIRMAFGRPLV